MIRVTLLTLFLTGCGCDISVGQTVFTHDNGIPGVVKRVNWFNGCEVDVMWQGRGEERGRSRHRILTDIGEE